jgi:hypothetical protein
MLLSFPMCAKCPLSSPQKAVQPAHALRLPFTPHFKLTPPKLGPLTSKSPQIRTLLATFELHIFARTTQTAPTSFTFRPFASLSSRPVFPIPHHILSTPTVLMATATSSKSEPVLVTEDPEAHRMQAQLTRFQMALGLKKVFESDGKSPDLC